MFDISFPELIVVGAIALVVLGPERLPTAARTAGLWLGKIKRTVSSMQQEITSQLEAEELQRKMKSQQDRFDQGLKKARDDIERLGDDPSASSRKLSDKALSSERTSPEETERSEPAQNQDERTTTSSTEPAPDRHANTADPSTAPAPASETVLDEPEPSNPAPSQAAQSDSNDRDKHDR